MKIETTIQLKIKDVKVSLSIDELKELSAELSRLLGQQWIAPTIIPVYPQPNYPYYTCSSSGAWTTVSELK
jgi:hypothetical protein